MRRLRTSPVLLLRSTLPFCTIHPVMSQRGLSATSNVLPHVAIQGPTMAGSFLKSVPIVQSAPTLPFNLTS